MSETPEAIQQKIDHINAMRALIGDAAADAAIAALGALSVETTITGNIGASGIDGTGIAIGHGAQAYVINLGTIIYGRDPTADEQRRLVWYLQSLSNKLYRLPLRGLSEKLDARGEGLALPRVYVGLDGDDEWEREPVVKRLAATIRQHREQQKQPDEQRTQKYQGLFLLAAPGGGKSTFLRHLAWVLAQRQLGQDGAVVALPGEPATWQLLPVLVPLRLLAGHLALVGVSERAISDALHAVMRQSDVGDVSDVLREALQSGTALLLFDGLDEVPVEELPGTVVNRQTTLHVVRSLATTYPRVPMVITCRVRAFDGDLRDVLGWDTVTIAPFSDAHIRQFAAAWYTELVVKGQMEQRIAAWYERILVDVVERSENLTAMARIPLLLTMMALILYNKGELPRDRPHLYERILELLLGQWDKVQERQSLGETIGVPEWGSDRIRPLLDKLSYEAHRDATSHDGRGSLARGTLYLALIDYFRDARVPAPGDAALRCLDYVDQRSGLLMPDGKESYAFAHLTLQEHCAGRYLVRHPNAATLVMQHRADDRWREPIFLGLGVVQEYTPALIDRILGDLIDPDEDGKPKNPERWLDDLVLVLEIGQDRDWNSLRTQGVNVGRLLRDWQSSFATALEQIPFKERIEKAEAVGRIGDPRCPVTVDEWQESVGQRTEQFGKPNGYWCFVPAGTYRIGGWKAGEASADIPLRGFWIARYPVTVAQYAAFIDAGAYEHDWLWTPNGWAWKQERGRTGPSWWGEPGYTGSNQAVVGVTWYEAVAFACWLQRHLVDVLPSGYGVCLPTDAEWEVAAAYDGAGNRRTHPWGEEAPTPERGVFVESGLYHPAPVGLCPLGAAGCGALDMGGQVWEPTTSRSDGYPRCRVVGGADFKVDSSDVAWRGGSYYSDRAYIRCSARGRGRPSDDFVGLRLVLAPRPT